MRDDIRDSLSLLVRLAGNRANRRRALTRTVIVAAVLAVVTTVVVAIGGADPLMYVVVPAALAIAFVSGLVIADRAASQQNPTR